MVSGKDAFYRSSTGQAGPRKSQVRNKVRTEGVILMKTKKVKGLAIFLIFFILLILAAGCGEKGAKGQGDASKPGSAPTAKEEPVKLSLASTNPNTGLNKMAIDTFQQKLNEMAPGKFKIELFMDGVLGGEKEALEQLKLGEIDMGINVLHAEMYYPELNATFVPFMFPDFKSIQRYLSGPMAQKIAAKTKEKGNFIELGVYNMGARWTTSNKPFTNPGELKGVKLRMPEVSIWIDVWKGLGAVTTPIPATDIFSSLQTGVIDAQENFITNIYGRKLYEVQKYLIDTEHNIVYNTWVINVNKWDKLGPNNQKIIKDAINAADDYVNSRVEEVNADIIKKCQEKGMKLVRIDKDTFAKAAKPHVEAAAKKYLAPGVYEEALKAIESR